MASHDVFISYSSADKAAADGVCHGLEARGVRCWMAPRDVIPGSDWQTALLDAIADARAVVLLFTENANTSDHIKREITAAFEGGAVVIPFRLENVAPKGALRYHLTGVHWLDAFAGEMDPHVDQLAQTVKRVLERAGDSRTTPAAAAAIASLSDAPPIPAPTPSAASPQPSPPPPVGAPQPAAATPPAIAPSPTPGAAPMRPMTAQTSGGIKPWMIFAGLGALAAVIIVIAAVMMSRGGGTPAQTNTAVTTSGSGVQIDLNARPVPPATGGPLPTLDPNMTAPAPEQPQPQPEQPVAEEPVPEEPIPEEPIPEEPIPEDTGQGGEYQQ